ncbi:hypothetical protein Rmet_6452 [Cupriavidus metallidurans CH34]|uniref:Uncharacterized protein n=1 Tax=Cupriavidus metallidurans (strain ATCC 43123 / DSM 2839 / NBRC 102507 / CH34) TaxID=266264 RepID=D3DXP7_CUPMC|nr:hypothetical protein Rmet_6452 [Cupriavidus metallidurans CH34]
MRLLSGAMGCEEFPGGEMMVRFLRSTEAQGTVGDFVFKA